MTWHDALPSGEREILALAGYGEPMPLGSRPALLIIDATVNFTGRSRAPIHDMIVEFPNACGGDAWDAIAAMQRLLPVARERGVPVIYTRGPIQKNDVTLGAWRLTNKRAVPVVADDEGESIVAEIAPRPEDVVVEKLRPSGFFGTPLASILVQLDVDTVLVCGGTTSGCVRATVVDAFSSGLRVGVVADATFDRVRTSKHVSLFDIDQKYGRVLEVDEACEVLTGAERARAATPAAATRSPT
jgi:nicotinamidase-related amidase